MSVEVVKSYIRYYFAFYIIIVWLFVFRYSASLLFWTLLNLMQH